MYWLVVQTVRRSQTALEVAVETTIGSSRAVPFVMAKYTRSEVRVREVDSHCEALQTV